MNILGIIILVLFPLGVGTIVNFIMRQKETSQIETYLIGFFSVFLLQGILFSLVNFAAVPFAQMCQIFEIVIYVLLGVAAVISIYNTVKTIKTGKKMSLPKKEDRVAIALMIVAILIVIARIAFLEVYERDDMMLETVRINVLTNTVNTYNPFTGRPYELGLITSKKLVTLPLYYTFWAVTYGIDVRFLLYIVATSQTVLCVFCAIRLITNYVMKSKKKQYYSMFFVGMLLVSGDYFKGAIGYRILWNGYMGDAIVAAIMIAYIIYSLMYLYRIARGDYGDKKWSGFLICILKILLVMGSTLFITSIATGALILLLCLVAVIVCTTLRFGREEKS